MLVITSTANPSADDPPFHSIHSTIDRDDYYSDLIYSGTTTVILLACVTSLVPL